VFSVLPVSILRSGPTLCRSDAQGAKPGEGGQLPGGKVNAFVLVCVYSGAGGNVDFAATHPRHLFYRGLARQLILI